jgi:Mg-chelatase subunit ChlD
MWFLRSIGGRAVRFALIVAAVYACSGDTAGGRPPPTPNGRAGTGVASGAGIGSIPNPNQGGQTGAGTGSLPRGGGGGRSNVCAEAMVNTSSVTPDVLFVIDGSGSMCDQFSGATRWQALRTALLDQANGLIFMLQAQAVFGMVLYDGTIDPLLALTAIGGSSNPECALGYLATKAEGLCPQLIEVPLALSNAMAINTAFPMTELGGSTPTDKAMNHAVDLLIGMQSTDPDVKKNPQYIILATDGSPNDICVGGVGGDSAVQKQGVIAAVDRARMRNITTFVISLAGNDQGLQAHVEEVADHGDPMNPDAHAFSPMTPQDLVATLSTLLGGAIGCNVKLDKELRVGSQCSGTVEIRGARVPCCELKDGAWQCNNMPVATPDGWYLKDSTTVELLGPTCDSFMNSEMSQLRAVFPCNVLVE